jgi:hyperpolarization activated cyclic nucleotide-gated potassium channel 2
MKIMKLLRLAKLKSIFEKFEVAVQLSPVFASIMSFVKLCTFVLFWSHWLGCIFHFVAINEDAESTSYHFQFADNWLTFKDLYYETWYVRYVNSVYWAVATMSTIGYGDISPATPLERLFGLGFLLVACFVFSYTLTTIGNTLNSIN